MNSAPIRSLMVANRGEIACRIFATAQRLGIRTVAVYSEADADSAHVAMADEAYPIGRPPPKDSYLNIDELLAAASLAGIDAIHPGYGFLSENAEFAEACRNVGLRFIGPSPEAIRAMGSKRGAKEMMAAAGVPVVPGYSGDDQSVERFAEEATRIGYPILMKASAGGGGRGMRIVERAEDLAEAVEGAKREALAAFGDGALLLEKYLTKPRHIEVQVFADRSGQVVHLYDRDCSVQRRHQKVVEEAPALGIPPAQRQALWDAAVAAARAVGYENAGTVEFVLDDSGFYFLEMNTRLQVEHPVTEAVTGLDLVEWQIRVAQGEPLPLKQSEITCRGHAVEVRLYAEDPFRGYLPQAGRITHLSLPDRQADVRIDTGVRSGDVVSVYYDPMIAKIISWGASRSQALGRMAASLQATEVVGLQTNLDLLSAIIDHEEFEAGPVDTGFLARNADILMPPPGEADSRTLALAVLGLLLEERAAAAKSAGESGDPHSPWAMVNGWRLNRSAENRVLLRDGDREVTVSVGFRGEGFRFDLPGGTMDVLGSLGADGALSAALDGVRFKARVIRQGEQLTVLHGGQHWRLALHDPLIARTARAEAAGRLVAPMPGKLAAVRVAVGEAVQAGAVVAVVEAMKMEHRVLAPRDGVIAAILHAVGDLVDEGAELLTLEAE
jgi:3-methylcrotonyl-CoA carboxylase alpha subunit